MEKSGSDYGPVDKRYMEYLNDKTTFNVREPDGIQVKKMYVNPEQDLSVDVSE